MRLLGILLAGLLSACTVNFTPAILRFEPDRGAGATYYVGEEVRFFLTLADPGWISLVAIDPDGRTYEFDRFYLGRGTHVLPPGAYRYTVTPPRGLQRVRAIYTDTHPGSLRLEGVYTDWDARLRVYLETSGARRYQVAETYFYIR